MPDQPVATGRVVNFLLIEDDEDHASLVRRCLEDARLENNLRHIKDGAEALEYLKGKSKFKDSERPDVILLDLNLPKKNGIEVLKEIKSTEDIKNIPVVILTTSSNEKDLRLAYDNHANSYLVKPMDFQAFKEVVDELSFYWGVLNVSAS